MRRILLVGLLLANGACSSPTAGAQLPATAIGRLVPAVKGLTITPPASNVAPQTAAFSGVWEGRWDGRLPSRLIVEEVGDTSAKIVYEWGDLAGPYRFKRGFIRKTADVTAPGMMHWIAVADMTFTMSKDHRTIAGTYIAAGAHSTVTMTKVA